MPTEIKAQPALNIQEVRKGKKFTYFSFSETLRPKPTHISGIGLFGVERHPTEGENRSSVRALILLDPGASSNLVCTAYIGGKKYHSVNSMIGKPHEFSYAVFENWQDEDGNLKVITYSHQESKLLADAQFLIKKQP